MSGSTEWKTPPDFFAKLQAEFGFNVDAAADRVNALVAPPRGRYYTAETEGQDWTHYGEGDRVWCNPPYSPAPLLYRFVEAASMSSRFRGALWVMLLNATSTDTHWFHSFVWDRELHRPRDRVELRLLPGRLRFLRDDGAPGPAPRYANMIVVFRPPLEAK